MPLTRALFNQIVEILVPLVHSEPERQTLIQRAFYGEPIVFCYEHHLVVELDGGIHRTQQSADALRRRDLEAQGLRVLRFPNDSLYTNLEDVLAAIVQTALDDSPLLAAQRRSGEGLGVRASDWQIRLPTEWEWQWAAQGGAKAQRYPWGEWQEGFANTSEAGLNLSACTHMAWQSVVH